MHPSINSANAQSSKLATAVGARILLVEDNDLVQRLVQAVLEAKGLSVDLAGNGLEALAAIEVSTYDLVLMDCQMPKMDGYTAVAEIRRREGTGSHLPVIALTAHAAKGDREKCLAAGMDDYLSKPIEADDLLAKVLQWAGNEQEEEREPEPKPTPALSPAKAGSCDGGVKRGSGRPELTARLLSESAISLPLELAILRRHLAAKKANDSADVAHRIMGVAALLGAERIWRTAETLERLLRSGNLEDRPVHLAEVNEAVRVCVAGIKLFLDRECTSGETSGI